jgi:hypothetical protein
VAAAAIGARRYPALGWMALANLAFHTAIAHKEYRFILLSIAIAVLLAAIGTVDRVQAMRAKRGDAFATSRERLYLVCWIAAFASLAIGGWRNQWTYLNPELRLYAQLRNDPALCGIALYRQDPFETGGYSYLHRSVPTNVYIDYEIDSRPHRLASDSAQFNTIMTPASSAAHMPAWFRQMDCIGSGAKRICLFRRPGDCVAKTKAPFGVQQVLLRVDR